MGERKNEGLEDYGNAYIANQYMKLGQNQTAEDDLFGKSGRDRYE